MCSFSGIPAAQPLGRRAFLCNPPEPNCHMPPCHLVVRCSAPHLLILWDCSQQGDTQHLLHVLDTHHVVALDHVWSHTVHQQLDVEDTVGLQQARYTICRGASRGQGGLVSSGSAQQVWTITHLPQRAGRFDAHKMTVGRIEDDAVQQARYKNCSTNAGGHQEDRAGSSR